MRAAVERRAGETWLDPNSKAWRYKYRRVGRGSGRARVGVGRSSRAPSSFKRTPRNGEREGNLEHSHGHVNFPETSALTGATVNEARTTVTEQAMLWAKHIVLTAKDETSPSLYDYRNRYVAVVAKGENAFAMSTTTCTSYMWLICMTRDYIT